MLATSSFVLSLQRTDQDIINSFTMMMTLSPVRMLENPATVINMNCVDPLGR